MSCAARRGARPVVGGDSCADRRREYRRSVRNPTHELVGVTLAVAAGRVLDAGLLETAGLAATALLGSRLPDVDQLGARVHQRTWLERHTWLVRVAGAVLRLPLVLFALVVPHRTMSHSALACAAAAALAALVASPAGAGVALVMAGGVAIGYASHVAADACTPAGVTLWAPLSRRRVWLLPRRARIRTGSLREGIFAAVAAVALASALLA
jgi:inner membrane protein